MSDTRLLRIRGRVQGVGFRAWLAHEAQRRGLAGWVRNRRDGSVEAAVRGDPQRLEELISRVRRGPPAARVMDVEVLSAHTTPAPIDAGFRLLPTE